jgi:hypothetical protein
MPAVGSCSALSTFPFSISSDGIVTGKPVFQPEKKMPGAAARRLTARGGLLP